jgi:DNA-binding transcriptional MocR family regulator
MKDILMERKFSSARRSRPGTFPARKLGRIMSVACRNHAAESIAYATSPGNMRLRSQIARWMLKAGCTLQADELIITRGLRGGLLALRQSAAPATRWLSVLHLF